MIRIRKLNNVFPFLLQLLFLSYSIVVLSKEIYIRNNTEFHDLMNIINENQNDNELKLYFIDEYYDFSTMSSYNLNINVGTNISIIGSHIDGTVFDYNNYSRGTFRFLYIGLKDETIKFNNIHWKNYDPSNQSNVFLIFIMSEDSHFHMEFNNCIFYNNSYIISVNAASYLPLGPNSNIIFNHCDF